MKCSLTRQEIQLLIETIDNVMLDFPDDEELASLRTKLQSYLGD